jgi:hypothetical protein
LLTVALNIPPDTHNQVFWHPDQAAIASIDRMQQEEASESFAVLPRCREAALVLCIVAIAFSS